jgi:adenylate cyclase, class 2
MSNIEVEVKFYLHDLAVTRNLVEKTGGIFEKRDTETNLRLEDRHFSLFKRKSLLRLRHTQDHNLLTYKGKVNAPDSGCKVYNEIEVMVSDFQNMIGILENIGYRQVQRYEKIRETYRVRNVLLCLDTMPYGNFMEIEGDPKEIKETAENLGFKWKDRILGNYLSIFEQLKNKFNLGFNDVTFDNFKEVKIDFESCLHLFVAG